MVAFLTELAFISPPHTPMRYDFYLLILLFYILHHFLSLAFSLLLCFQICVVIAWMLCLHPPVTSCTMSVHHEPYSRHVTGRMCCTHQCSTHAVTVSHRRVPATPEHRSMAPTETNRCRKWSTTSPTRFVQAIYIAWMGRLDSEHVYIHLKSLWCINWK